MSIRRRFGGLGLGMGLGGGGVGEVLGPELFDPQTLGTGWTDNLDGTYASDGTGNGVCLFNTDGNANYVYRTTYTVTVYTGGSIAARVGTTIGTSRSSTGTTAEDLDAAGSTTLVGFTHTSFNGTIGNISMKQIL